MIDLNYPQHITLINLIIFLTTIAGLLFYKYIYPKRDLNPIVFLIIISILPVWTLFRAGTFRSGDLTPHTVHLMSFYQNLREGVLIPRWAGELCGTYGCPTFIVEYFLPYYFASIFHFTGFSYLDSMKLVMALSFILSGVTMYIWAKSEFGKIPGVVASIFYLFAPYHIINLQLRGGVGETVSYAFIPLLFLFAKRLIETGMLKFFVLLSVCIFCLILAQSNTAISSLGILSGYLFILLMNLNQKRIKRLVLFASAVFCGFALSAFYWVTALLEIRYTWWSRVTYGDFKPVNEYLYSPKLFGTLFQGNQGEYRLIIGYLHLLIVVIVIYFLWKMKLKHKLRAIAVYLIITFFVLFFMMLSISDFIWANIPILKTFMMVWRLLIPIAFVTSALAGLVFYKWKNKYFIFLICFITIVYTVPNWANRKMVPLSNEPFKYEAEFYSEYFEAGNKLFEQNLKNKIHRNMEIAANPPKLPIEFLKGGGYFVELEKKQVKHSYVVKAEDTVRILENTNYFPGWTIYANYKEIPINYENPLYPGKIIFDLNRGLYKVDVVFEDTLVRFYSKAVSLVMFLLLFIFCFIYFIKFKAKFF